MRNRKLISLSLSFVLAASLLSACTSSADDAETGKGAQKVEKTTEATTGKPDVEKPLKKNATDDFDKTIAKKKAMEAEEKAKAEKLKSADK